MSEILESVVSQAQRARDVNARATPGPLLVRALLWACTLAAVLLAYPSVMVWHLRDIPVVAIVALLPAVLPRTRVVSLMLFAIVVGWVISTTVYGQAITATRLVALAALLYLVHTTAALAAVLPYDAVVVRGALIAWYLRALPVLAASALFGVLAVAGADRIVGRAFLAASIAGIALVYVVAWLLVRLTRS